jgi:MCM6 C-terminal winged-helix domain
MEDEGQQNHIGEYQAEEVDANQQVGSEGDTLNSEPMQTEKGEGVHQDSDGATEAVATEMVSADTKPRKKKQKTQITFEEYNAISGAIIQYLQSLDDDFELTEEEVDGEKKLVRKHKEPVYPKWSQVLEWYLEQCEERIGDSMEELERLKKLTNLVIQKLVKKDRSLIFVGEPPTSKKEEHDARLAVHPNFVRD